MTRTTLPRTTGPRRTATLAAAALAAAVALTGCSAPTDPVRDCLEQPLPAAPDALVLVVGVHAGTPAPALPSSAAPIVQATLAAQHPVTLIANDGTPATIALSAAAKVATATCDAFKASLSRVTNTVIDAITGAAADSDGNHLYDALALAGNTIRTGGWKNATIVVIDSGLTDTAPINFAQTGMTTMGPDQVTAAAAFATSTQPIDLTGITIQFHALAATAPPQAPLSVAEVKTVTDLWLAIATKAGATATAIPTPRTGAGPHTRHPVALTPTVAGDTFTPPTPGQPTQTTFRENDLHFALDSATLTDPDAARAVLAPLAAWLAADPTHHHVQLRGRTDSSGTPQHNLDLAARRAATVKTLLLNMNPAITDTQITTLAEGSTFDGFLPDTRPDGTPDPVAAAANRHVLAIATTT